MAGSTMTFTYDETGPIKKAIATWLSDDAAGTVTGITKKIVGSIIKIVTDPGSAAPTADYDIAITDEKSVDVLARCEDDLTDRHTANTEAIYCFMQNSTPLSIAMYPHVCDKLTIAVSAAGNAKTGEIIIYWKPG